MVSRGTWLRVVGGAGVCRRGVSTGVHHLDNPFLAVSGGVRGCPILLEGSVAVRPPPWVALGENLICGSDGGGYPWSYPSGGTILESLLHHCSSHPLGGSKWFFIAHILFAWLCPSVVMVLVTFVSSLGCVRCVSWWRVFVRLAQMYVVIVAL